MGDINDVEGSATAVLDRPTGTLSQRLKEARSKQEAAAKAQQTAHQKIWENPRFSPGTTLAPSSKPELPEDQSEPNLESDTFLNRGGNVAAVKQTEEGTVVTKQGPFGLFSKFFKRGNN